MFDEMKQLAEKKHEGQFRNVRKGEVAIPYIRHPESVAKNLLDWGEPEDSVAIGIAWGRLPKKMEPINGVIFRMSPVPETGKFFWSRFPTASRIPAIF